MPFLNQPQLKSVPFRSFPQKETLHAGDMIKFCLQGRLSDLLIIFTISLLIIAISLFLPFANQILFDYAIPEQDYSLFTQLLIGLALIFLSSAVFTYIKEYAILKVETYLNHDVEIALWNRLLDLPASFFRKFTVGDLLQRISSVTDIRRTLSGQFVRVTINGLFSCIYLLAMFYYSPSLSFIGLAFLLIGLCVTTFGFFAIKKRAMKYLIGIISGKVIQIIMGLSKIRSNGAESRFFRFWAKDAMDNQNLHLQMASIGNRINTADTALDGLKYFAIFLAVIGWIAEPSLPTSLSIGDYLAFNIALVNFASALTDLNSAILELPPVIAMGHFAKPFLSQPVESFPPKNHPGILQGSIQIDHISFRYNENGPWIHDDISLHANSGETIAIVGPSGCGKSSLLRLLLGFESPQKGAISYDNKNLASLDLSQTRSQISSILQNTKIMDGTIRENITLGQPYSTDEIMQAVRMAAFDDDLQQFPMGLHTVLTNNGTTISGGQRQRLFLARAFLYNAPIMFWDEATAGIDNLKQDLIMKNLANLKSTRIIIAHRLASIRHADRIYVLNQGKVAENGTFPALSQRNGLFAQILTQQQG